MDYVEVLRQRLSLTHQQITAPPPPASANPHQEGSLIFVMTTPPERTNKLTPRRKGPFRVKRVPNPYQVVYEDGSAWRTVHVNHTKAARLTAPDLPLPTPAPEPPRPALGYLQRSLQRPCSRRPPPPQAAAPTGGIPSSSNSISTHDCLLLRLPRVRGLLVAQHQPIEIRHHPRSLPRIRVVRYSLPPPRQPIRIQDLLLGRGDLRG